MREGSHILQQSLYLVLHTQENTYFDLYPFTDKDEAIEFANSLDYNWEDGDVILVFQLNPECVEKHWGAETIYFRHGDDEYEEKVWAPGDGCYA